MDTSKVADSATVGDLNPDIILVCSLSPTASALKQSGNGMGGTITFSFPQSESDKLWKAINAMTERALAVAIYITEDTSTFGNSRGGARKGAGRPSGWTEDMVQPAEED